MAATVDIVSGGRLIFGIGVGASLSRRPEPVELDMARREFDAYGVPLVPTPQAIGALGEALTITRRLWTEAEPFDFDGRYYQLKGAIGEPKPFQRPGPPILVGAAGERLSLRVVAEHADIWNCPATTPEELTRKSGILDEHCAAVGRNPAEIVRSQQILVARDDAARARDQILAFIAAGATHVVLAVLPPPSGCLLYTSSRRGPRRTCAPAARRLPMARSLWPLISGATRGRSASSPVERSTSM